MPCPYLEYHREAEGRSFAVERAYCTAASRFVQPLRADVCNDRHDLTHVAHCEIYRDAEGLDDGEAVGP